MLTFDLINFAVLHQMHWGNDSIGKLISLRVPSNLMKNWIYWEQLKDERLNDDKFLRMLEALYGSNDNKLAKKLLDYDFCSYQGKCTPSFFNFVYFLRALIIII